MPAKGADQGYWKTRLGIKDYFLFVGNISSLKNVENLITVFNKSNQNLVIVGDASLQDSEYFKRCQNLASTNTYFVGRLENGSIELNNAYYGAKAVIVPSLFETCSLVGLEAAIRSIPVIMTSEGATREIYKEDVIYINPFQLHDLLPIISDFQIDHQKKFKT